MPTGWLFDLTLCLHSSWKFLKLRISIIHQTSHSWWWWMTRPLSAHTLSHNVKAGKNGQNREKLENLQRSSFPSTPNNPHHQQTQIHFHFVHIDFHLCKFHSILLFPQSACKNIGHAQQMYAIRGVQYHLMLSWPNAYERTRMKFHQHASEAAFPFVEKFSHKIFV